MKFIKQIIFDMNVVAISIIFSVTMTISYVRINTTLKGYAIGELKNRESDLIERRSRLKMLLARLTKKESLLKLINSKDGQKQSGKSLASR